MRIGVVLWPTEPWERARGIWREVERLGFAHAWVYDHITWRDLRPWYDGYTTLAAAAAVTERIGLGPMVTSPNFRHPTPAGHALRTIDEISGGRLTVGIGAGSDVSDAGVVGERQWTAAERADRFAEWVALLDTLLREHRTTHTGRWWTTGAELGGTGTRPPFAIAASGPRGLALVARYGEIWVTQGRRPPRGGPAAPSAWDAVRRHGERLDQACARIGRDPATLRRLLLSGTTEERPLASVAAFDDYAGRYAELGVTDIVLHWPRPAGRFAADLDVLAEIAGRYAG